MSLDLLTIPGVGGSIGMMACPGQASPRIGAASMHQCILEDLSEVRSCGAVGVVSLLGTQEMRALNVGQLPSLLDKTGLWWRHLPIRDRDVPSREFEQCWLTEGRWIRAQFRDGKCVVLHCHAGLGRTGMIAARLLVEFGVSHQQAIELVRAARPGTIETSSQEEFVRRLPRGEPLAPG